MAKGGAFTDRDTSEVEGFIERKLLHRGVLGSLSRVDGVSIRPVVSGLDGLGRKAKGFPEELSFCTGFTAPGSKSRAW